MSSETSLTRPREFVSNWIIENDIEVKPDGTATNSKKENQSEIYRKLWLDYIDLIAAAQAQVAEENKGLKKDEKISGPKLIDRRDMQLAFEEFLSDVAAIERAETVTSLAFDKSLANSGETQLAAWLTAVAGEYMPHQLAVMQHWMWTVKRKMRDLPVVHHIMPVLFRTGQGMGKSTAVKKLISPLKTLTIETDGNLFSDERRHTAFGSYLVGFLDEMAHVGRGDVETLKRIITADTIGARLMRSNGIVKVTQRCSFIGTSNKPLSSIVIDSGMRRFYEITSLEKIDQDAINSIDYMTIWKSIDDERERGYIESHLESVAKDQKDLETEDTLDLFLKENGLKAPESKVHRTKNIPAFRVYEIYKAWCDVNKFGVLNSANFGKRIKLCGVMSKKTKRGATYMFSEDSEIKEGVVEDVTAAVISMQHKEAT